MLYFLTGVTSSGKSSVAHEIAIERNIPILSLDSMAVYKGLDILSAKPTDVMQAQVEYLGIDIAEHDQNFSVVDYLNYLTSFQRGNDPTQFLPQAHWSPKIFSDKETP